MVTSDGVTGASPSRGVGLVLAGERAEGQSGRAGGVGEYGRVLGCGGRLSALWAGRWVWLGGVEYGPDDLSALGGGQNPEGSRESSHDAEPSPVHVRRAVLLAR